jgi:uncharacterized membrane protein YbaN (DUF454 family)
MNSIAPTASRARRRLMAALGCVCVALGVVGIVVPGLPTTIFLLGASCLFAQSSPALHRRLMEHPRLGAYIRMAHGRSMTRRAKAGSLVLMWAGIFFCSFATIDISVALPITVCLLGAIGTAVLLFWVRTAPATC